MLSRCGLGSLCLAIALLAACNGVDGDAHAAMATHHAVARENTANRAPQPGPVTAGVPRVVFLGDSLTFGQGLESRQQAWPAIVAAHLAKGGVKIEAVNAGVSGDTTSGGLARLQPLLALKPDVLVIALGGNDATHGGTLDVARANLHRMVSEARKAGVQVLLAGLHLPPRLAEKETGSFAGLWDDLARELDLPEVPDMMAGVFDVPGMVQSDGVHPTVLGQERVALNVLPVLRDVLAARKAEAPHDETY